MNEDASKNSNLVYISSKARAAGGVIDPVLASTIRRLNNVPLDEGPGEGWHRHTHITLKRAQASRATWVMGSVREKQNIDRIVEFLRAGGKLAQQVFRFEWRSYKRLLRSTARRKWNRVKLTDKSFYTKMYRLAPNCDDWGPVSVAKSAAVAGDDGDGGGGDDKAGFKYEYLRTIFKKEGVYSFSTEVSDVNSDGPTAVTREHFFQVVDMWFGSHRMKLIPTVVVTPGDIAQASSLALSIQTLGTLRQRSCDRVTSYIDSCPEFVNALDVAPWFKMKNEMRSWTVEISDYYGCVDLTCPVQAKPLMSLLDASCPVLSLKDALQALGWNPTPKKQLHVAAIPSDFDSNGITIGSKYYFQVLLSLTDILLNNDRVCSCQPQSYYLLLLRGERVEPNQGHHEYQTQMCILDGNPVPKAKPKAALAIKDLEFDVAGGLVKYVPPPVPRRAAPTPLAKDLPVPLPLPDLPAPPTVAPDSDSSSVPTSRSSSSQHAPSDSSDADFDVAGDRSKITVGVVPGLPPFKLDSYKPKGKTRYVRWICSCTHHSSACKRKKTTAFTKDFGPTQPIAFLCAWESAGASITEAEHSDPKFPVSVSDMETWVAVLQDDDISAPLLALL